MPRFIKQAFLVLVVSLWLPFELHAGSVQLLQTGQTKCYDVWDNSAASCQNTSQDAELMTGYFGSFISGRFSDTLNSVYFVDMATGLAWPRQAGDRGKIGSCVWGVKTWEDAGTCISAMNDASFGEASDWRLPNVREMLSLTNSGYFSTYEYLNLFDSSNITFNSLEFGTGGLASLCSSMGVRLKDTADVSTEELCLNWLNNMLASTSFAGTAYTKIKPAAGWSTTVTELYKRTAGYRGSDSVYTTLSTNQQNNLMRLGRLMIEEAFPNDSPVMKRRGFDFKNIKASGFWTSTPDASMPAKYSWGFNISTGLPVSMSRMAKMYFWPVRTYYDPNTSNAVAAGVPSVTGGPQSSGVTWPADRFQDNENNTFTDGLTGLSWTINAYAPYPVNDSGKALCYGGASDMPWSDALELVKCLNAKAYLGADDWRLPNWRELESLIDYSRTTPSFFEPTLVEDLQQACYWSSTTAPADTSSAITVNFGSGVTMATVKEQYCNVWPVRGGAGGGKVMISPQAFNFGAVRLGESQDQRFVVYNGSQEVVTLTISVSGDGFSLLPDSSAGGCGLSAQELAAGGKCSIRIVFSPVEKKDYSGTLVASPGSGEPYQSSLSGRGSACEYIAKHPILSVKNQFRGTVKINKEKTGLMGQDGKPIGGLTFVDFVNSDSPQDKTCSWTASVSCQGGSESCDWIYLVGDDGVRLSSGDSGRGLLGAVYLGIEDNPNATVREAGLMINGSEKVKISQGGSACTVVNESIGAIEDIEGTGGAGKAYVRTTPEDCSLKVEVEATAKSWLTVTAAKSSDPDDGPGTWVIDYSTDANPNSYNVRKGNIIVAPQSGVSISIPVTQLHGPSDADSSFSADASKDFGGVKIGGSNADVVTLRNNTPASVGVSSLSITGDANFAVTAIQCDDTPVTLGQQFSVGSGSSCEVTITLTASSDADSLGDYSASLVIVSTDPTNGVISVPLTGYGTEYATGAFNVVKPIPWPCTGGETLGTIYCSFKTSVQTTKSIKIASANAEDFQATLSPAETDWLTVSPSSGNDLKAATLSLEVSKNTSAVSRTASVRVNASPLVTVTQAGANCSFAVSAVTPQARDAGSVTVTITPTPNDCVWGASIASTSTWISIAEPGTSFQTGSGQITLNYDDNKAIGAKKRSATIVIKPDTDLSYKGSSKNVKIIQNK